MFSTLDGCGGLARTAFLTVSILGGCGGLARTAFLTVSILEGVVVLQDLIFNSFYFGQVWWS